LHTARKQRLVGAVSAKDGPKCPKGAKKEPTNSLSKAESITLQLANWRVAPCQNISRGFVFITF